MRRDRTGRVRGRRVGPTLLALLIVGGSLACGAIEKSPDQVTRAFWEALRADDLATARALATADTVRRVEGLWEVGPIDEVLLGDALIGQASSIVRTSLATRSEHGRRHLSFDTTLVREDDGWKIDAAETHRALTGAAFASGVQELGDALGEVVAQFGEALESGAEEVSRAIREALEELEYGAPADPDPPDPRPAP